MGAKTTADQSDERMDETKLNFMIVNYISFLIYLTN